MNTFSSSILNEYGVEPTVAGARAWARIGSAERRPIRSAGAYVGVCRAMSPSARHIDGRLIAAGFDHVPPLEWVRGETGMPPRRLEDFVNFWARTQTRPDTVGSSYNATPEVAFSLWQGRHWTFALAVPSEHWSRALRPDGSLRRRWSRNCVEIGRALRRCSASTSTCGLPISARAAAALGRLCPEMQHAALQGVVNRVEARVSGQPCSSGGTACGPLPLRGRWMGMPWEPMCRSDTGQYLRHVGEERYVVSHPCLDWPETCRGTGADRLEPVSGFCGRVVRIRDLDWAAAQRVQSIVSLGDRARLRMVYDRPRRFERLLDNLAQDRSNRVAFLAPAYPRVDYDTALHLFLGMSPVELSGCVLSRREAHEWLLDGGRVSPIAWIVRNLPDLPAIRSANIARWLVDLHRRGGWGGLTRTRVTYGPAEARLEFRMIDRIDEIQDVDLVRGVSTSVDDAFRHASERLGAAWLETAAGDHRVLAYPPARWRLYPCMRALVTQAMLAREGQEMGHCVGGYSYAVERGQSVILALNVAGHRSTAEVAPEGRVIQHRAMHNGEPHTLCQTVLNRFIERRIA